MSTAIDANVIVYSLHTASPQHLAANQALESAFSTGESIWLFPPVLTAVLRVCTHRRLFTDPLSLADAFSNIRRILAMPSVRVGFANDGFFDLFETVASQSGAHGKLLHDAEIVALMKQHAVERILTADRDFLRFEGIEVTLLARAL